MLTHTAEYQQIAEQRREGRSFRLTVNQSQSMDLYSQLQENSYHHGIDLRVPTGVYFAQCFNRPDLNLHPEQLKWWAG